jgi:hypothetical protein
MPKFSLRQSQLADRRALNLSELGRYLESFGAEKNFSLAIRSPAITVSRIDCNLAIRSVVGCRQYFTKAVSFKHGAFEGSTSLSGAEPPPEDASVAAAIWGSADPIERSIRDGSPQAAFQSQGVAGLCVVVSYRGERQAAVFCYPAFGRRWVAAGRS